MYLDLYRANLEFFTDELQGDILSGFDLHQKKGNIEIITSPGTYPFLPFYEQYPANNHAHIEAALESHREVFSRASNGIWLPECGYFPGLETILREHGIDFFYLEAHGILFAENCPTSGTYSPVQTPSGVYAFARDVASVNRVWSDIDGYPGNQLPDFYRDIGHDLDFEYIKPYIHLGEFRVNTGYKYYAITGDTDQKQVYRPERALGKVREHADNFLHTLQQRLGRVASLMDSDPVITTPFSAELFGHWWFEGVQWLEQVIRLIHDEDSGIRAITPSSYLAEHREHQQLEPVFSSWGSKGYAEVWLNGSNDWIYRHLHSAIEHMQELVDRFPKVTGLKKRALNQAAREVLLAQTIDWAVIMRSGVSEEYARARIREHIGNFYFIYESLGQGNLGTEWLTRIERKNTFSPTSTTGHSKRAGSGRTVAWAIPTSSPIR
jgi:1,4-alpha-glucan branching enzyme